MSDHIPDASRTERPIITITTDFGLEDGYVASMKGVILGICPNARMVDVTHLIPPQDVRAGAFILSCVHADFPPGTIHLAVVDPGVGTKRRALAVRAGEYWFVGPDNGLFALVMETIPKERPRETWSLENPVLWRPTISGTFHGRDIFAPVAAHLARGISPDDLGSPCTPLQPEWNRVAMVEEASELHGEIIYIDHFGNAVSNLHRTRLEAFAPLERWIASTGGKTFGPVVAAYGCTPPGTALSLIGSCGYLEIAVNRGNAAEELNIRIGDGISAGCK